jgi:hypothetical protein
VQSGKTASGGCSAGPRFVRACSATDLFIFIFSKHYHNVIIKKYMKGQKKEGQTKERQKQKKRKEKIQGS